MKASLFVFLWTLLCFLAMETAATFWLKAKGDALDLTRQILVADADLGWRQRPNLSTSFLGKNLTTDSRGWRISPRGNHHAVAPAILLLGPSSAFGWGVGDEETYAAKLDSALAARNRRDLLMNASEIGFSTFQGLRLLASPALRDLHPSIILVAYGVNDLDRHRFYYQSLLADAEEFSLPHADLALRAFQCLSYSSLVSVMYKLANFTHDPLAQVPTGPEGVVVPPVRVGRQAFAANLQHFVLEGKKAGARVVFLGTPMRTPKKTDGEMAENEQESRQFAIAVASYKDGKLNDAAIIFQLLAQKGTARNEALYYLSAIFRRQGRETDARRSFLAALAAEPERIRRDVTTYNEVARKQAEAENISYVDLDSLFPESGRDAFFVDPIHPSALGHERIARAIQAHLFPD